jgi:pimeloyl-ACP methyl ester carboxylesterase
MTPRLLNVDGHCIAALAGGLDRGDAPVVFLHGILASPDVWLPTLPTQVRDARQWYSLGLPGHAPGGLAPEFSAAEITCETFADLLAAAIRQLVGPRPVELVGWSTGGFAALSLAARFPEIAAGVMSISGFAKGRWHGPLGALQRAACRPAVGRRMCQGVLRVLAASRRLHAAALRRQMAVDHRRPSSPALDETIDRLHAALRLHDLRCLTEIIGRIRALEISSLLPRIAVPTLIVGGQHDPIIPVSHTKALAAAIAGAKLAIVPDAGHLVFAENTPRYQCLLSDWLARVVPSAREVDESSLEEVGAAC